MDFDWDPAKNEWLKTNRDLSFEEIVWLIKEGGLRTVLRHPKRPNQKIFVVDREGYALNVPFVEGPDGTCFIKTAYPSPISTKRYLGEKS
jgi:hypothetical protein